MAKKPTKFSKVPKKFGTPVVQSGPKKGTGKQNPFANMPQGPGPSIPK